MPNIHGQGGDCPPPTSSYWPKNFFLNSCDFGAPGPLNPRTTQPGQLNPGQLNPQKTQPGQLNPFLVKTRQGEKRKPKPKA
jgi:hypothetical protein